MIERAPDAGMFPVDLNNVSPKLLSAFIAVCLRLNETKKDCVAQKQKLERRAEYHKSKEQFLSRVNQFSDFGILGEEPQIKFMITSRERGLRSVREDMNKVERNLKDLELKAEYLTAQYKTFEDLIISKPQISDAELDQIMAKIFYKPLPKENVRKDAQVETKQVVVKSTTSPTLAPITIPVEEKEINTHFPTKKKSLADPVKPIERFKTKERINKNGIIVHDGYGIDKRLIDEFKPGEIEYGTVKTTTWEKCAPPPKKKKTNFGSMLRVLRDKRPVYKHQYNNVKRGNRSNLRGVVENDNQNRKEHREY